jgi:hypothetical protein
LQIITHRWRTIELETKETLKGQRLEDASSRHIEKTKSPTPPPFRHNPLKTRMLGPFRAIPPLETKGLRFLNREEGGDIPSIRRVAASRKAVHGERKNAHEKQDVLFRL